MPPLCRNRSPAALVRPGLGARFTENSPYGRVVHPPCAAPRLRCAFDWDGASSAPRSRRVVSRPGWGDALFVPRFVRAALALCCAVWRFGDASSVLRLAMLRWGCVPAAPSRRRTRLHLPMHPRPAQGARPSLWICWRIVDDGAGLSTIRRADARRPVDGRAVIHNATLPGCRHMIGAGRRMR